MNNFASRAGEKLQFALEAFNVQVRDKVCADFGSSTGGFVDVLLQNGARKVYAVEVGYGTLDWKLRNDLRVIVLERTNAMHVVLPEKMDLITIDVGWTRQEKILPNAFENLKKEGTIISLFKPHYEADEKYLIKGRLRDEMVEKVIKNVEEDIKKAGGKLVKVVESPIIGEKGKNREFLGLIKPIF